MDKEEISAEFAFHDAMDGILQYLKARDLCRVAQVSRAWNKAVKLEFSRRRGPEITWLPDVYDSRLTNSDGPKFHASNELRSKPEFTLMLCGPRPHDRVNLNLETEMMKAYQPQLPGRLLVIGVEVAMMDEEEIRSSPSNWLNQIQANGIVGFFVPKFRQIQIKFGLCESHEYKVENKANRIVEQISPDDPDDTSTILLFGRSYYTIHEQVLSTIKRKFKPNTYTVWGGSLVNFLKTIDCQASDFPSFQGMEGCIAIGISGPSLERHSVVINTYKKVSEFESELADFVKGLKLKRCSRGLVCGPKRRSFADRKHFGEKLSCEDLMQMIKKFLPTVPFIGFFNESEDNYFGMNTGKDDADQKLSHKLCVSILILTYN